MKTTKRAAIGLCILLCIYVLSYVGLSLFGAYAPSAWGSGRQGMRPKLYRWAPAGFYVPATGEWRSTPLFVYAPLEAADNRFWHTHGHFPADSDPQHPVVFPGY